MFCFCLKNLCSWVDWVLCSSLIIVVLYRLCDCLLCSQTSPTFLCQCARHIAVQCTWLICLRFFCSVSYNESLIKANFTCAHAELMKQCSKATLMWPDHNTLTWLAVFCYHVLAIYCLIPLPLAQGHSVVMKKYVCVCLLQRSTVSCCWKIYWHFGQEPTVCRHVVLTAIWKLTFTASVMASADCRLHQLAVSPSICHVMSATRTFSGCCWLMPSRCQPVSAKCNG